MSRSARVPIPDPLERSRIVAILRRTEPGLAAETARALVDGGVPVVEVTCDSPGVLEMLDAIHRTLGDRVLLGAGTVLDLETAEAAIAAGARFIVSPHTEPPLIETLAAQGIPCLPGAFTASEVLAAWRAGAALVKLFPVGAVGPAHLRDLRGPLRAIPLMPTGGVTLDNAAAFIAAGAWGLGLGSALADPALVASRRFDEVRRRAAAFAALAAAARSAT